VLRGLGEQVTEVGTRRYMAAGRARVSTHEGVA
jgi:hypothetical protein